MATQLLVLVEWAAPQRAQTKQISRYKTSKQANSGGLVALTPGTSTEADESCDRIDYDSPTVK